MNEQNRRKLNAAWGQGLAATKHHSSMTLETSRDAVPEAFAPQITIYDETSGERVATVFNEEAAAMFRAAPDLLAAAIAAREVVEMIRDKFPDELRGGHCTAWSKLNAAIAKATE